MNVFLDSFFNPALIVRTAPGIAKAMLVTIEIAVLVVATGLALAQTLGHVGLPQAVRLAVPPLTNRTIAITKNTALGSVIGVPEILSVATTEQSFSGNATPLMLGAIAYVVLFIPVVMLGRWIETKFSWRRA